MNTLFELGPIQIKPLDPPLGLIYNIKFNYMPKEITQVRFVRDIDQHPIQLQHNIQPNEIVQRWNEHYSSKGLYTMYSRLFQCRWLLNFINGFSCEAQDLRAKPETPPETLDIEIWEMQNEKYLWKHVGWEKIEGFKVVSAEHSDPGDSACMAVIGFDCSNFTSGIIENGRIVDLRKLETPKHPWMEVEKFI